MFDRPTPTIVSGPQSAEFGEGLGSNTNLVMKSGTNAIHGSVYEFFRNDVFDARNFFSKDVEPLKQNQFGATVGGPLNGLAKVMSQSPLPTQATVNPAPATAVLLVAMVPRMIRTVSGLPTAQASWLMMWRRLAAMST